MIFFGGGCAESSLPCGLSLAVESRGHSLVAVLGPLIAVASLVAEHGFQGSQASVVVALGLKSCGPHA